MKKFVFAPSTMKGRISFSVDSLLSQKTIENLSSTPKEPGFTELDQEEQPDYTSDSNQENIEE